MMGQNIVYNVFISVILFVIIGVFCVENTNNAVFQFPEYDYKETAKNVCKIQALWVLLIFREWAQ